MSKYKSYRVSKIVYKRIIDKRKSELSCHKKKDNLSNLKSELRCSRDKEGNILCAGCKCCKFRMMLKMKMNFKK